MNEIWAGFLAFAYAAGSVVCHQLPDRSFHLFGAQLPLCARCTGLYAGGLAGMMLWPVWRRVPRVRSRVDRGRALWSVGAAAVPTVLSWSTAAVGLWDPSNVVRATLALPLGLAAGIVLTAASQAGSPPRVSQRVGAQMT